MDVPLGSGQGRDSLNSDNLESAFPDLSGWVPHVCPLRLGHQVLRGPRGCPVARVRTLCHQS